MTKISKIIDELNNQQADAAWITTPLNVYYFTGYHVNPMKDYLHY